MSELERGAVLVDGVGELAEGVDAVPPDSCDLLVVDPEPPPQPATSAARSTRSAQALSMPGTV